MLQHKPAYTEVNPDQTQSRVRWQQQQSLELRRLLHSLLVCCDSDAENFLNLSSDRANACDVEGCQDGPNAVIVYEMSAGRSCCRIHDHDSIKALVDDPREEEP